MEDRAAAQLIAALALGPAARIAGEGLAEREREDAARIASARVQERRRIRQGALARFVRFWPLSSLLALLLVIFTTTKLFEAPSWLLFGRSVLLAVAIGGLLALADLLATMVISRTGGDGGRGAAPSGEVRTRIAAVALAVLGCGPLLWGWEQTMPVERWALLAGLSGATLLGLTGLYLILKGGGLARSLPLVAGAIAFMVGGLALTQVATAAIDDAWQSASNRLAGQASDAYGIRWNFPGRPPCKPYPFRRELPHQTLLEGAAICEGSANNGLRLVLYEARSNLELRSFADTFDRPEKSSSRWINGCDLDSVSSEGSWLRPVPNGDLEGDLRCYRQGGEAVIELLAGRSSLVNPRNDGFLAYVDRPNVLLRLTSATLTLSEMEGLIDDLMTIEKRLRRGSEESMARSLLAA